MESDGVSFGFHADCQLEIVKMMTENQGLLLYVQCSELSEFTEDVVCFPIISHG